MFNLSLIVKAGIQAISNLVNMFAPDEIPPDTKKTLQKTVGTMYAGAKNFGPDLVASSDNDLDDIALAEVIEVCEQVAVKYDLELNPKLLSNVTQADPSAG